MELDCPLFTLKPLSTTNVANVTVKIITVGDKYIAGAVAQLTDYMEVLDMGTFDTRGEAEIWMNNKVQELWEACHRTQAPKLNVI